MQSLYQTQTTFKTLDMLNQMVDLSEYRMQQAANDTPAEIIMEFGVVGFTFGRQAGHTTAIAEWIKQHPEEKSLVITHNSDMGHRFERHFVPGCRDHCSVTGIRTFANNFNYRDHFGVDTVPTRVFIDGPAWAIMNREGYRPTIFDQVGLLHVKSIVHVGA